MIHAYSWDAVPELAKIDTDKIIVGEDDPSGEEMIKNYFQRVLEQYEEKSWRMYHVGAAQAAQVAKEYLEQHK